MEKYNLNDVFGVQSNLIKSYIERVNVDIQLKEAMKLGNEIIIYGSSKQGKTSLILKNLDREKYIKVECSPQTQTIDIYKSILRQLKVQFIEQRSEQISYEHGGKLGGAAGATLPLFGNLSFNGDLSDKVSKVNVIKINNIEYNLNLAQDFSEVIKLHNVDKFLVLENFHYLSLEVQKQLSFDLRVFQDENIIFIILGIWREANRLVQFNGDLLDRITEIPVEPWHHDDFERVIEKGESLLNVDFSNIKEKLINSCFDSIGVIQEICKQTCIAAGINKTVDQKVVLLDEHLNIAIEKKTNDYGVRHIRNFESFSYVKRKNSNQSGKPSLAFPYYFIKVLLTESFTHLEKGLSRSELLEGIRNIHHRPDDVRSSDLGAFLHNITKHQLDSGIQPPFVDYDRASKNMKIIDSTLYFFIKHCDKTEIMEDLSNPMEL